MSQRLIDAAKLIEHCLDAVSKLEDRGDITAADALKKHILWYLVDVESIDAVPVVRCKDCIGKSTWYKNESFDEFYICGMSGMYIVKDTDYCSYGERKDGDGNGKA